MTEASRTVFLSYASQDVDAVQRICDALRAGGIEVWFDKSELRGGDTWDRSIRQQIHDCTLFVPIISQNTHERLEGYFRREWKLAVDRTHDMAEIRAFLVPVVIDGTAERDPAVPEKFRELQWTRLPGGETPPAFVERIQRLLSPKSSSRIRPRPLIRRLRRERCRWSYTDPTRAHAPMDGIAVRGDRSSRAAGTRVSRARAAQPLEAHRPGRCFHRGAAAGE